MRHITWSAYERATHHGVVVRACDTSRGRRTSVRHITWSVYERATHHVVGVRACDTSLGRRTERATHHGVGVLSVRHITRSAYERATHHGVDVQETSGREQRRERDISMRNVVTDNYVKGQCISCDPNALGSVCEINQVVDFMTISCLPSGRCVSGL